MSSDPIRPKLRDNPSYDLAHYIHQWLMSEAASGFAPTQSCISCVAFDEPTEVCRKFNARPPARVIALSCPDYFDTNQIPF